ncbi:MAG: cyclic nucleotide-binding domain-containing protein, partial [Treponema sp.]|nr:cyclic nucleotide-binding domain-containing protein [Treponema sp.]
MLQLSFVNFKKGSYLVVEGKAESDRFFIIQSGNVRCYRSHDLSGEGPRSLGPGDFIGVIPCMSGHSQIETIIAMTDVTCISVPRDQYPELIKKNTPVALKIIRTFANSVRSMNETLTKLTLNNVVADTPEHIYDVASFYDKSNFFDIAAYAYYQYIKACPRGNNAERAKERFIALKNRTNAVYFESTNELLRTYPKGTMVFSESQSGPDMFIIQDGQVKISKVVNGNEVTLAILKKGDMFGEMALLENKPRNASAIAHEQCRLMVVNRQNFDQMISTQPQLIARLTTMLADRLWSMYRQIDNAGLREPLHKLIDMLALQIEKTKIALAPNTQYQTNLTPLDLVNMC